MKRIIFNLALLTVIIIGFSGCFLKSVHPLVAEEETVELPGISGIWESEDERFTFIKEGEFDDVHFSKKLNDNSSFSMSDSGNDTTQTEHPAYLVIYEDLSNDEPDSSYFLGSFVQLEQHYYLDLFPFEVFGVDFFTSHLQPVHTFSKINLTKDSLSIHLFQDEWIEEQIRDHKVRIKHEKLDEGVLITASTNELQQFIIKYSNEQEAYRDPIFLNRIAK